MKTTMLTKTIVTLLVAVVCGFAAQASTPRNYLYDTKEENGLIVSKTVFLQTDNGMLDKQVKYEFTYNEKGKVALKNAYRWDNKAEKWVPFYQTAYHYDEEKQEIESSYGLWNKKTGAYDLNQQKMILSESNYNDIFS